MRWVGTTNNHCVHGVVGWVGTTTSLGVVMVVRPGTEARYDQIGRPSTAEAESRWVQAWTQACVGRLVHRDM